MGKKNYADSDPDDSRTSSSYSLDEPNFEEGNQDESGKTAGPQSEQGLKRWKDDAPQPSSAKQEEPHAP